MQYGDVWSGEPFGWDRNPRIVDPAISRLSDAYHHGWSGAVLLVYSVRGQWTDTALGEMRTCFRSVLPDRHLFRVLDIGLLRLSLDLGRRFPRIGRPMSLAEFTESANQTFIASEWAFDRAVGILTGGSHLVPHDPPLVLPVPQAEDAAIFRVAEEDIGQSIAPGRGAGSGWMHLRESSHLDLRERFYSWSAPDRTD